MGHNAVERMVVRLLGNVRKPQPQACVKGRFFDRMQAKLEQLTTRDNNELVRVDLQAMADAMEASNDIEGGFRRDNARGSAQQP